MTRGHRRPNYLKNNRGVYGYRLLICGILLKINKTFFMVIEGEIIIFFN